MPRRIPIYHEPLPAQNRRWTIQRKAALLRAIECGQITLGDAMRRYCMSAEEIESWSRHARSGGIRALRVNAADLAVARAKARAA